MYVLPVPNLVCLLEEASKPSYIATIKAEMKSFFRIRNVSN